MRRTLSGDSPASNPPPLRSTRNSGRDANPGSSAGGGERGAGRSEAKAEAKAGRDDEGMGGGRRGSSGSSGSGGGGDSGGGGRRGSGARGGGDEEVKWFRREFNFCLLGGGGVSWRRSRVCGKLGDSGLGDVLEADRCIGVLLWVERGYYGGDGNRRRCPIVPGLCTLFDP